VTDDRSAHAAGDGDGDRDVETRPVTPPAPGQLPPDPAAYDSERNALARARGLAAPYIAGGRDPDPDSGRREERFYGRWLVAMVVVIVLGGFVLGIIGALIGGPGQ
jgi:hypothetical protein